ncbi:MAG TPA: glycosyltransferase [Thermodesulfovibrionales bacterium]|nr:glycosyltransferase [Thermodesulfovibrionales bacterium]
MVFSEVTKVALLLLITFGGIYCLVSMICVWDFFASKTNVARGTSYVPVSVLKPIKDLDPELRENLRSFSTQNYPEYELLLGFTESTDDAMPAAEEIIRSSKCSARIVISHKALGVNQKVTNLHALFEAARYPLVAISDSDMRVDSSYLKYIAEEYCSDKNVGLITSLYKISDPASLGSALESLTVALDFIPSVLVARRLEGITFGLGASMMLSKDALKDIGGVSVLADYLADDYQIGNRLWKRGYKIILSRLVLENVIGNMSVSEYLVHQLRWARTYRACRPKGFIGYGITHVFPFSLLLLPLFGPSLLSLSIIGLVLILRFSLAIVMHKMVIRSKTWIRWSALLPIKDLLSFCIWLSSFFGTKVFWRGSYYKIIKGGRIKQV